MAFKPLGGVDYECRLPHLLLAPLLSLLSLSKQGVASLVEDGVEPLLTTGRTALGGQRSR